MTEIDESEAYVDVDKKTELNAHQLFCTVMNTHHNTQHISQAMIIFISHDLPNLDFPTKLNSEISGRLSQTHITFLLTELLC